MTYPKAVLAVNKLTIQQQIECIDSAKPAERIHVCNVLSWLELQQYAPLGDGTDYMSYRAFADANQLACQSAMRKERFVTYLHHIQNSKTSLT